MRGPAVLLVSGTTLRSGLRPALAATLGLAAATSGLFVLSACGVTAIIAASGIGLAAIRLAGAAFSPSLGTRLARRALAHLSTVDKAGDLRSAAATSAVAAFRCGLVVHATNPQLLVYFLVVLPLFVNAGEPVVPQLALLGAVSVAIKVAVYGAYGIAATLSARRPGAPTLLWIEALGGVVLIVKAGAMASSPDAPSRT